MPDDPRGYVVATRSAHISEVRRSTTKKVNFVRLGDRIACTLWFGPENSDKKPSTGLQLEMPAASSISGSGAPSAENGGARRLVAIAFADIVGYSILMSEDEQGTHRRWMELLTNILRPGAERHRGRIVKSTGDGVLAEFPSALDAVDWGREVQEATHREEAAESSPIALRIAVHVGDVMTTADDIYGDGVNIAARLQEHGQPGGIILSELAYNLVRHAYGSQARDLGFLNLKNFERPFRAYAIDGPRSSVLRRRYQGRPLPT